MKIAFVHDWLVTYAGAERVLEQMIDCFPNADIFSLIDFVPAKERGFLRNRPVRTSFLQNLPRVEARYRNYLPLMPLAIEQFDLSDYDVVVSNSHAIAKGVITGPDQLHICMCHAPVRYAWDLQAQYLKESSLDQGVKSWMARWILHRIRAWDRNTADGVDVFFASSEFTRRRIMKVYRRESEAVIYPPVDVSAFTQHDAKEDFYLTASRMVPYKKMDLIVEAFAGMRHRRLVVIGTGPGFAKIQSRCPPNVSLLGFQQHSVLRDHMQRARGFVFAAKEDFGIVPLEAQACGTPVIAFGEGGALDTIRDLGTTVPTGVYFEQQTVSSLVAAIERFEANAHRITPTACRRNAERFSNEVFKKAFQAEVSRAIARWRDGRTASVANQVG